MVKNKLREGFYEYLEGLKAADQPYLYNLGQLKIWADAAFAEADFKNSVVLKELIEFAEDIESNYDCEESSCRCCKAKKVLKLIKE